MEVIIAPDRDVMSKRAAVVVADLVRRKPNAVLGLATGSTPVGLYKELIRMRREEGLDFSQVTTFNLDEYWGLSPTHDQSYHYFMNDNLFAFAPDSGEEQDKGINVPADQINILDGMADDASTECFAFERRIREAGGIDLQILGIGGDGHIAFNEPGSSIASRTRLVVLHEKTIEDNARFFEKPEDVQRKALTMGVGTILETRSCLILASGAGKAEVWAKMIEAPVTSQITASALQFHPWVLAISDEDAASKLQYADYYRHVAAELADEPLLPPAIWETAAVPERALDP